LAVQNMCNRLKVEGMGFGTGSANHSLILQRP
jgi:hypothetical protein